ncbi:hypothetical protein RSOL_474890 [Rhizoctonia solani AG-3 Rhs1AP]|nr:hypothetical protein RSOL_474890 [Rhizoctonia solani AG-3 Rhs1AP]
MNIDASTLRTNTALIRSHENTYDAHQTITRQISHGTVDVLTIGTPVGTNIKRTPPLTILNQATTIPIDPSTHLTAPTALILLITCRALTDHA